MKFLVVAAAFWLSLAKAAPTGPTGTIEGSVLEKGKRRPVVGATVLITETSEFALTDDRGRFRLATSTTPPITVKVLAPGYEVLERRLEKWHTERDEPFYLQPKVVSALEVLVEAEAVPREAAKRVVSPEQISKAAGTGGDALKVVQDMPGVARTPFSGGGLIVRGSAPEDTRVFLDGHPIPLLFHFGGLTSTFNSDLIRDLRYYPGGYSVRYGRAMGGIVDVRSRPGDATGAHGYADLDFYDATGLVEGPLGGGRYTGTVRRSYVDAVIKAAVPEDVVRFTLAPRYYDYQFSYGGSVGRIGEVSLMSFGARDDVAFVLDQPPGREVEFRGDFNSTVYQHRLQGAWEWDPSDQLGSRLSAAYGPDRVRFEIAGGLGHLDLNVWNFTVREELAYRPSPLLTLYPGLDLEIARADYDTRFPRFPREGDVHEEFDPTTFREAEGHVSVEAAAPYLEAVVRPVPALSLIPGVRLDVYHPYDEATVDPRFSTRVQLTPDWALKGGVGLFHQPPQGYEIAEGVGNPELGSQQALQFTGGTELALAPGLEADVQGFYKALSDLIVRRAGTDISNYDPSALENAGKGRVYGAELYLTLKKTRGFGWLSYTLSRSERRNPPDESYRLFDFDQTHILTAVGTVHATAAWDVGLRFRYSTGNPATPITDALYDADRDRYIPLPGDVNSTRVPPFHQLDLRIDRRWRFNTWMLTGYLDVQNVYVRYNPEGYSYNYDFSEKQSVTGPPILPSFGVRAEF